MATYLAINPTTAVTIAANASNTQQQVWVLKAEAESRGKNPFQRFTGGWGPKWGGKPIIEVADTLKLKGQTINLQTLAPLAGPGIYGDNVRLGNEEIIKNGSYQFTIGRLFKNMGWTSVAANQTVVGSNLDRQANKMLGEWMGWQKGYDVEFSMLTQATARNQMWPNGKTNREALRTTDYVSLSTISDAGATLNTLMGKPVKLAKSSGGFDIEKFIMMSNQYALRQVAQTSEYRNLVSQSREKGDSNELWAGGFPDVDGHALYRWDIKDHAANGPIGAGCVPRATLGIAITANDLSQDITGGGNALNAAVTPAPQYFQNFSNSAYMGCEGLKRAADTTTTRYVLIQNTSGANVGKMGFYSYQVNNGNKLTMLGRLRASAAGISVTTLGNVTWDTAPWVAAGAGNFAGLTDSHPSGSLVYETNSYGVPFTTTYMFGDECLMSGYGTVDGQTCMGIRKEEKQDYDRSYGVGLDICYGVQAIPRVDGIFTFIVLESAWSPPGLPQIT